MIRYQHTFQAVPRKIIAKHESDFITVLGSGSPFQGSTENDVITRAILHKQRHTSQTMQTLCSMEMTAIGDETIEKPEDDHIMKACLREIDIQNSTNRTGIAGIFLHGYITNNVISLPQQILSNQNIIQFIPHRGIFGANV